MRIVGGDRRGRALTPVGKGDPRAQLRPTSDRVREAIFNVLAHGHGDPVPGARVLDVFAGTGAMGLEALSRGAAAAVFIESGRKALELLARNIALLGTGERTRVIARDATRPGPPPCPPATLVFCDPPYGRGLGERALAALADSGWIAPGALVVWEEATPQTPPQGFVLIEGRTYGETWVGFLNPVIRR